MLRACRLTAVVFCLRVFVKNFLFVSRRPEQRFEDYIPVEEKDILEPKKQILKRSKDLVVPVGPSQKVRIVCYGIIWLVDMLYRWSCSLLASLMLI